MEMKASQLFLLIKIHKKVLKKVLILYEDLNEVRNFDKFQGFCLKIELAIPISILKYEWV